MTGSPAQTRRRGDDRIFRRCVVLAVLVLALAAIATVAGAHEETGPTADPHCLACRLAAASRAAVLPEPDALTSIGPLTSSGRIVPAEPRPRSRDERASAPSRAPPPAA